jgi:hypothetical protein
MAKVMYIIFLTKNGLGYILGDHFTNSSGHPDVPTVTSALTSPRFDDKTQGRLSLPTIFLHHLQKKTFKTFYCFKQF